MTSQLVVRSAKKMLKQSRVKDVDRAVARIASLAAKMVEITDEVLATDACTREGQDAKRFDAL